MLIRLGSGDAKNAGVGGKAALLDRARAAGLPVPDGVVILETVLRRAVDTGLLTLRADHFACDRPGEITGLIPLPAFSGRIAVRSAFSVEDNPTASLAGFFVSRLDVDPTDSDAVGAALVEVWSSSLKQFGTFRCDVLVMEMVAARTAGVAFTEREHEDDLVNFTDGLADRLVGGLVAGQRLMLAKLRRWESPTGSGFEARLQRLLRDVRRVFGDADWDVEWADDGATCWLVQLRPVTRPTIRDEAFTIANHKEILPDPPSRFMASLIAACADSLFAYYRGFDPTLPAKRPFIENYRGRPFINLSLLTDMVRHWGLPTKLITDSVGGEADCDVGINPGRIVGNLPVFFRLGWAQLTAVGSAREAIRRIAETAEATPPTFVGCVAALREIYVLLVREMFSLTGAMSGPLAVLRRFGVLAAFTARHRTITTELYSDLEPLRRLVAGRSDLAAAIEAGETPSDPAFLEIWQRYLDKHGHRGVYESDIARPRFHETPHLLLDMARHSPPPAQRAPLPVFAPLVWPLWWQAARAIRAREELRYHAMRAFDRLRRRLLELAQERVRAGGLPNVETLWMLDISEAVTLDEGFVPDAAFLSDRTAEIAASRGYTFPDLFHRFDDLETFRETATGQSDRKRFSGLSLTIGTVSGKAWVLSEPAVAAPFPPEETILVARSVDAGWIPTFSRVAGVVVETGGDLSHGSIVLREIGLPAITNVQGVTRAIETGDPLILRAGEGIVERR